jgi:hypothetical protein
MMRPCVGDIFFQDQSHIGAAELTEAARIAEHYEQTKQFAPAPEEPTRAQVPNGKLASGSHTLNGFG